MSTRPCDQKDGQRGTWQWSQWLRRETMTRVTMTRVKGLAKIKKKIERDVTDSRITTVEPCDMTWHWHDMTIMTMTVTVDTRSTRYRASVWRWTLSSTVSQFNSVTRQWHSTVLDCSKHLSLCKWVKARTAVYVTVQSEHCLCNTVCLFLLS